MRLRFLQRGSLGRIRHGSAHGGLRYRGQNPGRDPVDGFLRRAEYLIHDRDPLFSKAFIAILKAGGVKSVKIPAQSPNCNPYAERFIKTIKYECLNHFAIFGERHLHHLIKEFVEHYMTERFHQVDRKKKRPSAFT